MTRVQKIPLLFFAIILMVGEGAASTDLAEISLVSSSTIKVDCEFKKSLRVSFIDTYGSLKGISKRVTGIKFFDERGGEVKFKQASSGRFLLEEAAIRAVYNVDLTPPSNLHDAAHISWLTANMGLIMTSDLLPEDFKGILQISFPSGWSISSSQFRNIDPADSSVFLIGKEVRKTSVKAGSQTVNFATNGAWPFADQEALEMIKRILKEYEKIGPGFKSSKVIITRFPGSALSNQWSAETRGSTVTILLGEVHSRSSSLAQLGTILTHELFHLWVPNYLNLRGNYDWFYEGFTLYKALLTGQRLGFLTFQDLLRALSTAFEKGAVSSDLSLIELSRGRWQGTSSTLYNRGLLVAFLYDLRLRERTGGRRSIENLYEKLIERHGRGRRSLHEIDATTELLNLLSSENQMSEFVKKYIVSPSTDFSSQLAGSGLYLERVGARPRLLVSPSLKDSERELLRQFGYN
jgi:hypothetical protein